MIPKRISLFWTGRMSWMRYLTLWSLRKLNPDWEICLIRPTVICDGKKYKSKEMGDGAYVGCDYNDRLSDLNLTVESWEPTIRELSAAQASDICQWGALYKHGGFYSDMDILWLKPLDNIWEEVRDADAVFCLENEDMAIGFVGASPYCPLFYELSIGSKRDCRGNYQGYGVCLVHNLTGGYPVHKFNALYTLVALRQMYSDIKIVKIRDESVYPFYYYDAAKIFDDSTHLSPFTIGLHWFGGLPISQLWNNLLTEDNWGDYNNTFTLVLQGLGYGR